LDIAGRRSCNFVAPLYIYVTTARPPALALLALLSTGYLWIPTAESILGDSCEDLMSNQAIARAAEGMCPLCAEVLERRSGAGRCARCLVEWSVSTVSGRVALHASRDLTREEVRRLYFATPSRPTSEGDET
jgi:hypothetical protein